MINFNIGSCWLILLVFFLVCFQDSDSDGAQKSVDALFENKKKKKQSGHQKSKTKKNKYNDSSEKNNIAELEFINNAIKATKTEKKSQKQKKKKEQT